MSAWPDLQDSGETDSADFLPITTRQLWHVGKPARLGCSELPVENDPLAQTAFRHRCPATEASRQLQKGKSQIGLCSFGHQVRANKTQHAASQSCSDDVLPAVTDILARDDMSRDASNPEDSSQHSQCLTAAHADFDVQAKAIVREIRSGATSLSVDVDATLPVNNAGGPSQVANACCFHCILICSTVQQGQR